MDSTGGITVFSAVTTLLTTFIVVPKVTINNTRLSSNNPKLVFVCLIGMFGKVPNNGVMNVVFCVYMLFTKVDSLMGLCRTPITALRRHFKLGHISTIKVVTTFNYYVTLLVRNVISK